MENADQSILLQFAKFSKGFRISDFEEFVEEFIGVENLDFFGRLAYPNQWQIRLSNQDLRERLIRMGRTRIKNRSCWMYPLNKQEIRGFVHWLPNSVTNDELREELKLYGKVLFIESQERTIKGRKVESDPRYYGLMLEEGTDKETIPHFLKINGFLCHLAVRGREPACFHCKEVGHRRAECSKYKTKLVSYCNRDPYTAPLRLKPRGRRHVKVETEVEAKTGGDEVSSSADIVHLETKVLEDDETTEQQSLPVLEDRDHFTEIQEEASSSTEKELAETSILVDRTAKSYIGTSTALFSETERQGIDGTLQQIQQRAAEDLRQRLENFGKEIAQTLTRGKLSVSTRDQMPSVVSEAKDTSFDLEQERSNEELEKQTKEICASKETVTAVESAGENSNADTNVEERKGDEIPLTLPTMHQVKEDITETHEKIPMKSEEMAEVGKLSESTVSDTVRSLLLTLEKTKQAATETIESTFRNLEEFVKSNEAIVIPSEESVTDTEQKLARGEMRSKLVMLEEAKQTAADYFGRTFKELEEEISRLSIQLTDERTDTDTKLTKEDIQFAYQKLKQTEEAVGGILENTFKTLVEQLEKETEPSEITTESSAESKSPPKVAVPSTKYGAVLKQFKQEALDIVKHFGKEGAKVVEEAENSEIQSTADKRQKETIKSESDLGAMSQDISESGEESEMEAGTKDFIASKRLESHSPKPTQESNELQMSIRQVFTSTLAKDELLPETRAILKQVESAVNEVVEEMKNRQ